MFLNLIVKYVGTNKYLNLKKSLIMNQIPLEYSVLEYVDLKLEFVAVSNAVEPIHFRLLHF